MNIHFLFFKRWYNDNNNRQSGKPKNKKGSIVSVNKGCLVKLLKYSATDTNSIMKVKYASIFFTK